MSVYVGQLGIPNQTTTSISLIEQGWMAPHEAAPPGQAMRRLAQPELTKRARTLSGELGMPVLTYDARRVSRVHALRIDPAQGRMALIAGEREAKLGPWRPALERFAGREVVGVIHGPDCRGATPAGWGWASGDLIGQFRMLRAL